MLGLVEMDKGIKSVVSLILGTDILVRLMIGIGTRSLN